MLKRWIVRLCWLAAWCGWVWLGVGLHRELPRKLGPVVCELPLSKDETPFRFVKNSSLVLVQPYDRRQSMRFKVFDAKDGKLVHEIDRSEMQICGALSSCNTHGVLFASISPTARIERMGKAFEKERLFFVVDLAN